MKILGLITARGGSKGVPKKNIKILGDKPLIAYSIESAQASTLLDNIVVSTDSDEIVDIAEKYGVRPPFKRPADLALDASTSLEVIKHAVNFFEVHNIFFDAICLLQPTSPFREPGFIDKAIQKFKESGADTLVSVLPVPHEYNPHWVFEENDGLLKLATGEKIIIPRRQDLPKAFHRDGSIYIIKTQTIKSGTLYGKSISYIESNPDFHVNIDTMDDWFKAESLLKQRNK